MNKIIIFLAALAILTGLVMAADIPGYGIVSINGKKIVAKLALTDKKREIGLSGREKLCGYCGMLFIFPESGNYSFWMKGMNFDLDLVWISKGNIIHIEKNVSRESSNLINPGANFEKVLEINAGTSEKHGFKVGDKVKIYGI